MLPLIQVKQGKLRGIVQKTLLTGDEYYAFLGIPYAKPPINELRFQAPVPLSKWDGILDASKDGMPCKQIEMKTRQLIGSEDCLYLNVYTPKIIHSEVTNRKPVMVYIHGGGFLFESGASDSYPPDHLINYDVVFVTLNYRLHVLGFLNMGTKNATPNCGLRDQSLALKWVKENIQQFGGDPENITIVGESAGAVSVHYHLLSPLSKGLFHKAILQSGTVTCSWGLNKDPVKSGLTLAKKLGYAGEDDDAEKIVEFFKKQSVEDLSRAVTIMHAEARKETPGKNVSLSFIPSIEAIKENAFIPYHPEIMAKTATPIPIIAGFNDKEGRLAFVALAENLIASLQQDFTNIIKYDLQSDEKHVSAVCEKIKKFYFGKEEISQKTSDAVVNLYTDILFRNFYESIGNFINSKCPVYLYEFSFNGKFSECSKWMMHDPTISFGAAHADELRYLFFKTRYLEAKFEEPELTVIKNLCSLWSNFARTGNPTQGMNTEWRPSTTEKPCYLQIDKQLKLIEGKMLSERFNFWKSLQI